jgi:hypothetical protein
MFILSDDHARYGAMLRSFSGISFFDIPSGGVFTFSRAAIPVSPVTVRIQDVLNHRSISEPVKYFQQPAGPHRTTNAKVRKRFAIKDQYRDQKIIYNHAYLLMPRWFRQFAQLEGLTDRG